MGTKYPRGAEWLKWDLHVHSPESYDYHGDWDSFKEQLKNTDCAVIGINDYFTVAGYKKLKEEITNNTLDLGEKKILPVVEMRMRDAIHNRQSNSNSFTPFNFHIIFDDSIMIDDIENFIKSLPCDDTTIGSEYHDKESLRDKKVSFEGTINSLKNNKKFQDKYLIWLPYDEYGGIADIDPNSDGWIKRGFIKKCHILGSSNKKQIDFFLWRSEKNAAGLLKYSQDNFREWFDNKKPCIKGSDSHSSTYPIGKLMDNNSNPIEKYCWIKANPTFEGLRQIVYEPELRVSIGRDIPEKKTDYQVIDRITLNHPDFQSQEILFNQNLNTIVGGRSSGKSILLGVIATKIGTNLDVKESPRYQDYVNAIVESTVLKWRDGEEATGRDIEYFPQSHINDLAAEEVQTRSLIERTIKSDENKRDLIDGYNNFCIENKGRINKQITNYFTQNQKYKEKEEEIKAKGNKKGIEKEIEKIEESIITLRTNSVMTITNEEIIEFEEKTKECNSKKDLIKELESSNIELEKIKTTDILVRFEDISLSQRTNAVVKPIYDKIKLTSQELWVDHIEKLLVLNKTLIEAKLQDIIEIEDEETFKKCREYYNSNDSFLTLEKVLIKEKEKLNDILILETENNNSLNKLAEIRQDILELQNKYYDEAALLIQHLQFAQDGVQIVPVIRFKEKEFRETLAERFNLRSSEIQNLVQYKYSDDIEFRSFMENKIFDPLIKEKIALKGFGDIQQVLTDILSRSYYEIGYDVIYQSDKLSEMSEGKKAFIILRLLLDFNSKQCPILIDQPEDDLDNRAVFNELVSYLRKKKAERQIILVTHNPNIVVGSDAEEVIVANQHGIQSENPFDIKFFYTSGALEDSFIDGTKLEVLLSKGIKEHVCEILEGGDSAFKKRTQKYGFNK